MQVIVEAKTRNVLRLIQSACSRRVIAVPTVQVAARRCTHRQSVKVGCDSTRALLGCHFVLMAGDCLGSSMTASIVSLSVPSAPDANLVLAVALVLATLSSGEAQARCLMLHAHEAGHTAQVLA